MLWRYLSWTRSGTGKQGEFARPGAAGGVLRLLPILLDLKGLLWPPAGLIEGFKKF